MKIDSLEVEIKLHSNGIQKLLDSLIDLKVKYDISDVDLTLINNAIRDNLLTTNIPKENPIWYKETLLECRKYLNRLDADQYPEWLATRIEEDLYEITGNEWEELL